MSNSMESFPKSSETYGGRKLIELLAYSTHDLEPTEGFKLELRGLTAVPVMHSELEAYFGASLDEASGAEIVLGFDQFNNEMILEQMNYPLKSIEGRARLIRTESLGYVPIIEIRERQFNPSGDPMEYAYGQVLLRGFAVEDFGNYDISQYKQWRESIISRTSAWQVTEKVEVPLAFTDDMAQSVILSHSETMDLEHFTMLESDKVTKSIVVFKEDGTTDHTEMSLESIRDLDEHSLPIALTTFNKSADIFEQDGFRVGKEHTTMLPLNRTNFEDFKATLENVNHLRKSVQNNN